MEIWKDIEGFEGKYQVSNLGRVKSLARVDFRKDGRRKPIVEKVKKACINGSGYFVVSFTKGSVFLLHRLIAEAFISNPDNKKCVNHINGIKTDNRIENLEWATHSENNKHAYDTGLKSVSDKVRSNSAKLMKENGKDCSKVVIDLSTGIFYSSIKEAAECLGMVHNTLQGKLLGRSKNNTSLRYA